MKEHDYPKPKSGGAFPKNFRLLFLEIDEWEYRLDIMIGNRRWRGEPYQGENAELMARRAAADIWRKMNVKADDS